MLMSFIYPMGPTKPDNYKYGWAHIITYIMVWSFCAVKPILYVHTNKYFRKAFYDTYPYFKPNDYNDNIIDEVDISLHDSKESDVSDSEQSFPLNI